MLNHAGRTYLPMFQDQLRTSVLGGATGRKMLSLKKSRMEEEEGDEAVAMRSRGTDEQIQAFLDAWHVGDEDGLKEAMSKVVQGWRADNAAGGVPVHAHLPLPKDFSKVVARLVGETHSRNIHGLLSDHGQ